MEERYFGNSPGTFNIRIMIEANELTKGRWVNKWNPYYNINQASKVKGILDGYVYFDEDGEAEVYMRDRAEVSAVCGIPITAEIMVKAGFVESKEDSGFWIKQPLVILVHDSGIYVTYCQVCIPCKYLHQLQNLYFALTGEELNVNL